MYICSSNNKLLQVIKTWSRGIEKTVGSEGLLHLLVSLKRYKIIVLINLISWANYRKFQKTLESQKFLKLTAGDAIYTLFL